MSTRQNPFVVWGSVAGLCIVAAIAAVWLLGSTRWQAPPAIAADPSLLDSPPAIQTLGGGYDVQAVLARPLLLADRRPMAADPDAEAETPPSLDDLLASARVLGLLGSGDDQLIIVQAGGTTQRVALGGLLGGWRLVAVESASVTFEDDSGTRRVLEIRRQASALPAARANAPAAGAVDAHTLAAQRLAQREARRAATRKTLEERVQ